MEVRLSNMNAAKAVSDAVRTSLGPKGMDKMVRPSLPFFPRASSSPPADPPPPRWSRGVQIQTAQGEVVITNDGATILKHMAVLHPAARMVGLSFRVPRLLRRGSGR